MFHDAGMRVRVYAFGREWYDVNNSYAPGVEVIDLGSMRAGHYINRLPLLWKAIKVVRTMESAESVPALAYAFELDSALIMHLAINRGIPHIYEVGDIRNPDPSRSIETRLIYAVERGIVKRVDGVAVVADGLLTDYYAKMHPGVLKKGIVVENKLPREHAEKISKPSLDRAKYPVRIGLIGLLRYPETVVPLMDAVSKRPGKYELHFFGDGPLRDEVQRRSRTDENVFYHGPYKNPDDLKDIYSSIHVNYLAYNNTYLNIKHALPNRLYESMFFGTPMVVPSNTAMAQWVERLGIGFVVDPAKERFVEEFLDGLTLSDLDECGSRAHSLPDSLAVQNDGDVMSRIFEVIRT